MNSKLIKGLNVSPKIIKFLEENIGSKYFDISLSNFFLLIVQVHFPLTTPLHLTYPHLPPSILPPLALSMCEVDPGIPDLCVVAETRQIHTDYQVL